jgi:hypothetical protein
MGIEIVMHIVFILCALAIIILLTERNPKP